MKAKTALFLGFFAAGYSANSDAASVKLVEGDLPRLLREKNDAVKGSNLLTEASRERSAGYLARSFVPTVEGSVGIESFTYGPGRSGTEPVSQVEARVNVFRGGRDSLEQKSRDQLTEGAKAQAQKTYATEIQEARREFWTLVYQRELIGVLKQSLKRNDDLIASAERRIQRGVGNQTDRLEFEIKSGELREEIESLEHENKIVELRLSSLLGFESGTSFETVTQVPHQHDDAELAKAPALDKMPDLALIRAQAEAASLQASQAGKWWMPSLDLFGRYSLYTERDREFPKAGDRDEWIGGVRLSIMTPEGFFTSKTASSYSIQASGLATQAAQKARALTTAVQVAKEEMIHDHELIHTAETRTEQGKKYLDMTLDEYGRGVKNSPDVLNAMEKYLSYQKRHAELRHQYQLSRSSLLAISGE